MKILIINGPNLNLLGTREESIYGSKSFKEIFVNLSEKYAQNQLEYFQSNIEGELINQLQNCTADKIILNAGGYTHTSVAIRDAIASIQTPVIEVHISNIAARETFRHDSLISPVCEGCIFGFGIKGYEIAIQSVVID